MRGCRYSKKDAKVCVRADDRGNWTTTSTTVTTWAVMAVRILDLGEHGLNGGVSRVVMVATSDYYRRTRCRLPEDDRLEDLMVPFG